jgi:peptidoglycan/LPS O-acetylase OafA/YrhL
MNKKIVFANTLRGFAAFSVVISHYLYVFGAAPKAVGDMINAPALTLPPHAFASVSSGGPFGVALFFLISGFVIPFSLQKTTAFGFMANRLLRILPVYAVGFTLTLGAIWLCGLHFGRAWPFDPYRVAVHYLPGMRDVLNVQTIDGIIWTLDIEMKFYVICTVAIVLFRRQSILVFCVPLVIAVGSLSGWWWLHDNAGWFDLTTVQYYHAAVSLIMASQFVVFMFIGVVFHYLYMRAIARDVAILLISVLFSLYVIAIEFGPDRLGAPLLPKYAFAILLFAFAYRFPNLFRANRVTNFFAQISYPLYVSHGVNGYVALRLMLGHGIHARVAFPVTMTAAVALAYVLHITIERPSQALAKLAARAARETQTASAVAG